MSEVETETRSEELVLDYELAAPPEKVWRAISIPAFRERWLPGGDLADPEPVASAPGEAISYRMRDAAPSAVPSVVTFRIRPNGEGGTHLRIVQEPMMRAPAAANDNRHRLMLAA